MEKNTNTNLTIAEAIAASNNVTLEAGKKDAVQAGKDAGIKKPKVKAAKEKKLLADKPKAKKEKAPKKGAPKTSGVISVKDLEEEFGMKAKVIRRYLRKMDESTKPRGPEKYQWDANSKELKAVRKNLQAISEKKASAVR